MSGDGKDAGVEELKQARHAAESHKDVSQLRKYAKKHAADAASYERKALRQEWWARLFTKSALRNREKAKKYMEKVEKVVARIAELRRELKDADPKRADGIQGKIARQERRKARFHEKAVKRESRAASRNDTAANFKIKAKTFRQKAKEEEEEARRYSERADILEKVTD